MKTIIAIIPHECVGPSRKALAGIGIAGVAALSVRERGRRNLPPCTPGPECSSMNPAGIPPAMEGTTGEDTAYGAGGPDPGQGFLLQGMLLMVVDDEAVLPVVQALRTASRNGDRGDGRIFICPMVTTLEIGDDGCGGTAVP